MKRPYIALISLALCTSGCSFYSAFPENRITTKIQHIQNDIRTVRKEINQIKWEADKKPRESYWDIFN